MTENLMILLVSAALNGAVTWGVVSTKLDWMRRDLDELAQRMAYLERKR